MIAVMQKALVRLFDKAPVRRWTAGQALFRTGDAPTMPHLVTSGRVALVRTPADGTELPLHTAQQGDIVAEASAYAVRYICDARAAVASPTRALDRSVFRAAVEHRPGLAAAWAADLAGQVQQARFRIEVRTLRTVRTRLDAWLAEGQTWPPHGPLQDIAAEIGVTREALYRELSRRRRAAASAPTPMPTISLVAP